MTLRIEWNHEGFDELLKSPEVQADLERRAQAIADQANALAGLDDGFEVRVAVGNTRARASVFTATPEAMLAEAHDYALTRSIDAARSVG